MFSGGIEEEQWLKMGSVHKSVTNSEVSWGYRSRATVTNISC